MPTTYHDPYDAPIDYLEAFDHLGIAKALRCEGFATEVESGGSPEEPSYQLTITAEGHDFADEADKDIAVNLRDALVRFAKGRKWFARESAALFADLAK